MSLDRQQTTSVLTQFPNNKLPDNKLPDNKLPNNKLEVEMERNAVIAPTTATLSVPTAEEIEQWIITYLAEMLEISTHEIEADVPFDTYGLDSSAAVGLTGDLEDWLNREVDPTILYDYPTVERLADYLSEAQPEGSHDNN